jgi:ferredoxin
MSDRELRVDWIRCDGYGLCGDLVPDLIDLDEWRYPIVRPGPIDGGRLHDAQRAVDCCPMKALFLEGRRAPRGADRSLGPGPGRAAVSSGGGRLGAALGRALRRPPASAGGR